MKASAWEFRQMAAELDAGAPEGEEIVPEEEQKEDTKISNSGALLTPPE